MKAFLKGLNNNLQSELYIKELKNPPKRYKVNAKHAQKALRSFSLGTSD